MPDEMQLTDEMARQILAHLCGDSCHGFAEAAEVCESRGDCTIIITCPGCKKVYTLTDDQYEELVAWSMARGQDLACGIQALPA